MNKQVGMAEWQKWADSRGYGEDAYSMTENDLHELASSQIAIIDEEGWDYEEFEITATMEEWARR